MVSNNKGETQSFGYFNRVRFQEWTPLSKLGEHTIVWSGPNFVAVGENKYDDVRKVGISPNLEHLNYVASKDNFEFIYHKKTEGKKYKSIKDYSLRGSNDDATYIGEHILSKADDGVQKVDLVPQERSIFHVVQGENLSDWYEAIEYFQPKDTIEEASFIAKRKGLWEVYKGKKSISTPFHEITWFNRSEDEKIHYMGRDRTGWHEFHDGKKTRSVSTLLPLPVYDVPKNWKSLIGTVEALVNENGDFIYSATKDHDEVIYHKDKEYKPVHDTQKIWVFEYGKKEKKDEVMLLLQETKDNLKFLVQGDQTSELFEVIEQEPMIVPSTGDVYVVVYRGELSNQKLTEMLKDNDLAKEALLNQNYKALKEELKIKNLTYPFKSALLHNTKTMLDGDSIQLLEVQESGPICEITMLDEKFIYHSGDKGPKYDELKKFIWGDSLATSRYIYNKKEKGTPVSYFLGSTTKLLGPYDSARLVHKEVQGKNAFVFLGVKNHLEELFIDEKKISSNYKIKNVMEYGKDLVVRQYGLNTQFDSLADQPYSRLKHLESSNIEVEGTSFGLLLKKEQDVYNLQFNDKISDKSDLLWDIRSNVEDLDIVWTWLSGEIDYNGALVQVYEKSLRIPKGSESVLLQDLKPPKEEEEEEEETAEEVSTN